MKKTSIVFATLAVFALGFVSCNKEDGNYVTFYGTINNHDSKCLFDPSATTKNVVWSNGETIRMFNTSGTQATCTATNLTNGGINAQFNLASSSVDTTGRHFAISNFSTSNTLSNVEGAYVLGVTLPSTVQLYDGKVISYMAAEAQSGSRNLEFKHVGGMLELGYSFTSSEQNPYKHHYVLNSITISSPAKTVNGTAYAAKPLSGSYTLNFANTTLTTTNTSGDLTYTVNGSNTDFGTATTGTAYFPMPVGEYHSLTITFNYTVYKGNGQNATRTVTKTMNNNSSFTINRAEIFTISGLTASN